MCDEPLARAATNQGQSRPLNCWELQSLMKEPNRDPLIGDLDDDDDCPL